MNALANLYIQDQINTKFQATENAVAWLSERVTELEAELLDREDDLQTMRTETDLISPEALEGLNRQLIDVRNRLAETRTQIALQEQRGIQYRAALANNEFDELARRLDDPTLSRLLPDSSAFSRVMSSVVRMRCLVLVSSDWRPFYDSSKKVAGQSSETAAD